MLMEGIVIGRAEVGGIGRCAVLHPYLRWNVVFFFLARWEIAVYFIYIIAC